MRVTAGRPPVVTAKIATPKFFYGDTRVARHPACSITSSIDATGSFGAVAYASHARGNMLNNCEAEPPLGTFFASLIQYGEIRRVVSVIHHCRFCTLTLAWIQHSRPPGTCKINATTIDRSWPPAVSHEWAGDKVVEGHGAATARFRAGPSCCTLDKRAGGLTDWQQPKWNGHSRDNSTCGPNGGS